ncbi:ATP-binding protein [Nocardia aurea]|uniref:ATP-binding protein n=1 Tax=Nocardia aurea TaxID=2144174 RepID=UPI0013004619|nr:tetratricopeptide repeat protein [Nocardia aurea]
MTESGRRTEFFAALDELRTAARAVTDKRPPSVQVISRSTEVPVGTLYSWFPTRPTKTRTVPRKDEQLIAVLEFFLRRAGRLAERAQLDRRTREDWLALRDAATEPAESRRSRDRRSDSTANGNEGVITAHVHHSDGLIPAREQITTSLPPAPRTFVGRETELRQILDAADRDRIVAIHAIDGMAGIGKTTLAVYAAHQLRARFPHGQYFVELHAHTPGRAPEHPAEVLARLLAALGVDPRAIPDSLAARRDLWRHRLSDKKVLLVLDDATDRAQIEPLLPSGPQSLTVITSRRRLLLVPDMRPLPLEVLTPRAGTELFLTITGRNAHDPAERDVASRIVALCGQLPLSIGLVAGRVAHHPGWTVTEIDQFARELAAATNRLSILDDDGSIVRAAFDLSYNSIPPGRQLLFRRMGLHPGAGIDAFAAAALLGTDPVAAARELGNLHTDHLIDEIARGRYRLHDLLRDYSRALAAADPPDHNHRARDRLLDYYQHTAAAAGEQLTPANTPASATTSSHRGPTFGNDIEAMEWLRRERSTLLSYLQDTTDKDPTKTLPLISPVASLLIRDGPWSLALQLLQQAADLADRFDRPRDHAEALAVMSEIQWNAGANANSTNNSHKALALYRELGDRRGEANILVNLGCVSLGTSQYGQAADLFDHALAIYGDLGDRYGQAIALLNIGEVHLETGEHTHATEPLNLSLTAFRELGLHLGQANTLLLLARLHRHTGHHERAADLAASALQMFREFDNHQGEANTLNEIGANLQIQGTYSAALDLHRQALVTFREIGYQPGELTALNKIGAALLNTGEPRQASAAFSEATRIAAQNGCRHQHAHALLGTARANASIGDIPTAVTDLTTALTIYQELDLPEADATATELAALRALY